MPIFSSTQMFSSKKSLKTSNYSNLQNQIWQKSSNTWSCSKTISKNSKRWRHLRQQNNSCIVQKNSYKHLAQCLYFFCIFALYHMSYFLLSNLIDKFVYYLQYEKNSSPKTIENYSLRLNRFLNHIGDVEVSSVKPMQVLDYRMHLHQQDLNKKTINYHIVALRSFFKFCLKNDINCISPEKLELSKTAPREVSYMSEDEVNAIILAPISYTKNLLKRKRDEAILAFLYGTGLRVSELTHLKFSQISTDNNQFRVIGK